MGLHGVGSLTKEQREIITRKAKNWDTPWTNDALSRPEKVIAFCEDLPISSGELAGEKMVLRSFQKKFIRAIYEEGKDNNRKIRTAILSMGRKNGKTQIAAALALCHLSGPEAEERGEIYSCANDRFQAAKIFNEMEAIIMRHAWLRARINIVKFRKELEDLYNGSTYNALSKEAKTKFGLSPTFVVYDELGQTEGRELYDAMDSAMGARKNPMMLIISTQAASDHAPLSQLIDYGLRIQNKEIKDNSFHLTLYRAPENADPWDEKTWKAANPALDDFRSLPDVKRLANQAQRMPARENSFRNLILNQRVAAEARFVEPALWRACGEDSKIPVGERVYAGLDLSGSLDLSALVIVYVAADGVHHVRPYAWLPGDPHTRGEKDGLPYEGWIKEGKLFAIGETVHAGVIAHKIQELNVQNKITCLAFDRWKITELKRELDAIGCSIPLLEVGQGFKGMGPVVDLTERLIVEKKIRHGNHPVLTAAASAAVIARDPAGARKFDKAKSTSRIDALVAMGMALYAARNAAKPVDIEALIG
jgi:phage terminase large subunit-like protein